MADDVSIILNGTSLSVPAGHTVAAVLLNAGRAGRSSVGGQPRAALCGMGRCHECRVTIDGQPHQLSCEVVVQSGMEVRTDA